MGIRGLAIGSITVLLLAGLSSAAAGSSRLHDCYIQRALLPITREHASRHLPEGFEPSVGAAGNEEAPYLHLETWACGNPPMSSDFEIGLAYLGTEPTKRYARKTNAQRFILAATAKTNTPGTEVPPICYGAPFSDGEIDLEQGLNRLATGASQGTSVIESKDLSVEFEVATAGAPSSGSGSISWFYKDRGGKIADFETREGSQYISVGAARAVFEQPFLDFPPVMQGFGIYDQDWIIFPEACP